MKNIVFGVNDNVITDEDKILSAAILHHQRITPALRFWMTHTVLSAATLRPFTRSPTTRT